MQIHYKILSSFVPKAHVRMQNMIFRTSVQNNLPPPTDRARLVQKTTTCAKHRSVKANLDIKLTLIKSIFAKYSF